MAEPGGEDFRAGIVAVSRPNAEVDARQSARRREGRDRVGQPQTTRKRVIGVLHRPGFQLVLVDTPGIHRPDHRMNAAMVRDAVDALEGCDAVLWVVDASARRGPGDRRIAGLLRRQGAPLFVALNKVDRVAKADLLPQLRELSEMAGFTALVPVSALTGDGMDDLLEELARVLPSGPPLYPGSENAPGSLAEKISEQIREPALS
jgi:GTP-binding protein Era